MAASLSIVSAGVASGSTVGGVKIVNQTTATGTFDVQLIPNSAADAAVTGMAISETFHGDLDGTSAGQMLAVRKAVDGAAGYVAMEHVAATLASKHGTFALQHSGSMEKSVQSLAVTVVPDSATDGLAGLIGSMAIKIDDGQHTFIFRYALPH
jgi:hypothetical protein